MSFWLKQTAIVVIMVFLVSIIVFSVLYILPGDVADVIIGDVVAGDEVKEALRAELGLNDPMPVQYGRWLFSMISGNFGGNSITSGQPIGDLLTRQLPVTLLLTTYTLALSYTVGTFAAKLSVRFRNTLIDRTIRLLMAPGLYLPNYWLALLLVTGLVLWFRWSPPLYYTQPWQNLFNHIQIMALPVLLLTWEFGSHIFRITRASILEILKQDHITAATARGFSLNTIIEKHGMRGATPNILSISATQLSLLLGGTVILEYFFGLPGMGRELVEAALSRDLAIIQTYVTLLVLGVLSARLLLTYVRAGWYKDVIVDSSYEGVASRNS